MDRQVSVFQCVLFPASFQVKLAYLMENSWVCICIIINNKLVCHIFQYSSGHRGQELAFRAFSGVGEELFWWWMERWQTEKPPGLSFLWFCSAVPSLSLSLFKFKLYVTEMPKHTSSPLLINPPLCAFNSLWNQPGKRHLKERPGQSVCY